MRVVRHGDGGVVVVSKVFFFLSGFRSERRSWLIRADKRRNREGGLSFGQKQIVGEENNKREGEDMKEDQLEVYIDDLRAQEMTEENPSGVTVMPQTRRLVVHLECKPRKST